MDIPLLLQSLQQTIKEQAALIVRLQERISVLENKKNSSNSHTPPAQDPNRPKKNQSLREPSDKKVGGQPGHEGTTLRCSDVVDVVVKYSPASCDACGCHLDDSTEQLVKARQLVDIPPIALQYIEHQVFKKQCSCGHITEGNFPKHVANHVQYGPNVESLIGYLHARQYLPYKRTKEFLNDVMGLSISEGGINNILQRFAQKATPMYEAIKQKITQASVVGADETGVNINGSNHWVWTWQNEKLTYIVCAASRGYKTIQETFSNGLPNAVLIHDRWAAHFNTNAEAHQICTAHLLRELNYINELYKDKCKWAVDFKTILLDAIGLKKELTTADYYYPNIKKDALFERLERCMLYSIDEEHKKANTLRKKLLTCQDAVLYFLLKSNVVPDNNGSERAIRNIKVKQKISGQFKTLHTANVFAIIRSIIDTTIKNGNNVFAALNLIAISGNLYVPDIG